jgi:hypothetical protein
MRRFMICVPRQILLGRLSVKDDEAGELYSLRGRYEKFRYFGFKSLRKESTLTVK